MPTHLLSSFMISISSNFDNFAVGIAYGVKKIRIGMLANLLIALVSALGTFLAISVGNAIAHYFPAVVDNWLGSLILIGIGVWGIWDTLKGEKRRKKARARWRERQQFSGSVEAIETSATSAFDKMDEIAYEGFVDDPAKADTDQSGYIDIKESIVLSLGLTINNLGGGVGAGISGLNIYFTAVLTFIFSILAILCGDILGTRYTAKMSVLSAGIISGCLMICLGIYEYFIP